MDKWDQLYIDCHIATMTGSSGLGIIKNAAIAVVDNKIAWLGPEKSLVKTKAPTKSLHGAWLTPGLIDCHTHLVYAGNRSDEFEKRLSGQRYQEIVAAGGGIYATVNATRSCSEEELYQQSLSRLQAMINHGVTTVEIKSGYGLDLKTEMKMLKVARNLSKNLPINVKTTCLAAHVIPYEYRNNPEHYIEFICEELLPKCVKQNLVDFVDVFCETIAFSNQQARKIFTKAKALGLRVKCHAEQLSHTGSAKLAADFKAVSIDHLEYANIKDIQAMAISNSTAVLLPGAFYFLQEKQKPPIKLLRENQIPIAIATDCNPGSSPTTSLPLMMNMACVEFGLTIEEVWRAVTINAARALAMQATHGSLAIGKAADFSIWRVKELREVVYQIAY